MADIFGIFDACPFVGHGYTPVTDEGLYAELQRFHRSTDAELDDFDLEGDWNEEDA